MDDALSNNDSVATKKVDIFKATATVSLAEGELNLQLRTVVFLTAQGGRFQKNSSTMSYPSKVWPRYAKNNFSEKVAKNSFLSILFNQ